MRKKFFLIITGGMLVSLLLCILCTGVQAAQENPYKGITLTIPQAKKYTELVWLEVFNEIAAKYGMKIKVAWYTSDALVDKVLLGIAAGETTWDLFYANGMYLASFVKAGAAIPLNEYIENPELTSPEVREYLKGGHYINAHSLVSDGSWGPEGAIWGIAPCSSNSNVLWYREDLFNHPTEKKSFKEKYGHELQVPRNWIQFREVAEFFTRKKGEMLAGEVLENDFYGLTQSWSPGGFSWHDYATFAHNFGYEETQFDLETGWPNWDSPLNKACARYLKSLMPYHIPGTLGFTSGASASMFAMGKTAMTIEYLGRGTNMFLDPEKCKIIDKLAAAVPPKAGGLVGKPRSAMSCDTYCIYALSQHKEAAYKLLQEASTYKYQKMAMQLGQTCLLDAVWDDPELLADPTIRRKLEFYKLSKETLNYVDPRIKESSRTIKITGDAITTVLAGIKGVDEVYDEAQKQMVKLFREKGYIE